MGLLHFLFPPRFLVLLPLVPALSYETLTCTLGSRLYFPFLIDRGHPHLWSQTLRVPSDTRPDEEQESISVLFRWNRRDTVLCFTRITLVSVRVRGHKEGKVGSRLTLSFLIPLKKCSSRLTRVYGVRISMIPCSFRIGKE